MSDIVVVTECDNCGEREVTITDALSGRGWCSRVFREIAKQKAERARYERMTDILDCPDGCGHVVGHHTSGGCGCGIATGCASFTSSLPQERRCKATGTDLATRMAAGTPEGELGRARWYRNVQARHVDRCRSAVDQAQKDLELAEIELHRHDLLVEAAERAVLS